MITRLPVAHRSSPGTGWVSLSFLAVVLATVAMTASHAAEAASGAWEGRYKSVSLDRLVTVRLSPPAGAVPGELRFVTLTCALALEPSGASKYVMRLKPDEEPGPYCGLYFDGQVVTRAINGDRLLRITITDRNGRGNIDFKASYDEASGASKPEK